MKIIHGPDFKMHLLADEDLLPFVLKDLQDRFSNIVISDEKPIFENDGWMFWDPGGSLIENDIKFSFRISDNLSLVCRSQHWDCFKLIVSNAGKEKRKGNYHKLHSQMYALCLTDFQMQYLQRQIIKHSCQFDQVVNITNKKLFNVF